MYGKMNFKLVYSFFETFIVSVLLNCIVSFRSSFEAHTCITNMTTATEYETTRQFVALKPTEKSCYVLAPGRHLAMV